MRYYFDVDTAHGHVHDREGTEYFHRDDMQTGAIRLLLEIARDELTNTHSETSPYALAVHVRDATGRTVSTVTLGMSMIWSGVH